MTTLMYQIAKERHLSVKAVNSRIPEVVEKIIDKAMEKDVATRYQKARQMAEHIKKVVARIDELQAKKNM